MNDAGSSTWYSTKEVLQKKKGRRLCYVYGLFPSLEPNPLPVAPRVLKFGIHLGKAGRQGVRGREEEGWSGGGVV
jgi:hypothetical protein